MDGDCRHKIKKMLAVGRKAITNLENILKSKDTTLLSDLYSQSHGFPSSRVWIWDLDHSEGWKWKSLSHVQLFCDSHGILQARILGWAELLQKSFPTQGLNPGLPHCKQVLYQLSFQGSPEGWMLKNWCFWIVLEKTLESPLDCKEIKPVNPKRNQPWIFIGRTDAELQYWGHLM